jgi:hypothetical protein
MLRFTQHDRLFQRVQILISRRKITPWHKCSLCERRRGYDFSRHARVYLAGMTIILKRQDLRDYQVCKTNKNPVYCTRAGVGMILAVLPAWFLRAGREPKSCPSCPLSLIYFYTLSLPGAYTRIAASPLTGHLYSHVPQPMHSLRSTTGAPPENSE